ncbi:MAG: thermostable hemolysin delta-VPH [Clostridiales bacterium]|nr:thermostable hemolysin delta-VPH [Clostridiales bacterium]
MTYYNYHAIAKNLIKSGHCIGVSIFDRYRHIYPAMVLYFENHRPIPIREYMWQDYLPLLDEYKIRINNPQNIPLE